MKTRVSLLAAAVIAVLVTMLVLPCATASSEEESNDSWYSDGPQVTFYAQNATTGEWLKLPIDERIGGPVINLNTSISAIKVQVEGPTRVENSLAQDYINWWMGYLTSVTYKASWQNSKEVQVYTNTSNSGEKTIDFKLTNMPPLEGKYTLEVAASCVVYYFASGIRQLYFPNYHHFLYFTDALDSAPTPTPIPTPKPLTLGYSAKLAAIMIATLIAIAVIALSVYKKTQTPEHKTEVSR